MTQPTPVDDLDYSKTPNPQIPPPAPLKTPDVPTSSQLLPKTHNFPLHKILLIALIALAAIFITAYVGVYYLLNQQLDKITKTRSGASSIAQTTPTPTIGFPTGSQISITPTCTPRPACLDSVPRCMIPETADMCPKATPTQTTVACTQEAKQCSDGSYVSRQGPACEFAACP